MKHDQVISTFSRLSSVDFVECTFEELKKRSFRRLDMKGIYLIYEDEEVIYVGSSYVQTLKKRLLQYTYITDSGNTLMNALINSSKATNQEDAISNIMKLKIRAFKYDDDLEYELIGKIPGIINSNGVPKEPE